LTADLLTVTETAKDFLQKAGHNFPTLQSAIFDQPGNRWVLQFDIGLTNPKPKKVILDPSGKVMSFE
jgi:hypothetical protein